MIMLLGMRLHEEDGPRTGGPGSRPAQDLPLVLGVLPEADRVLADRVHLREGENGPGRGSAEEALAAVLGGVLHCSFCRLQC